MAVLGILAAVAIPKYASHVLEARTAALNGLAGAVRSSVIVVQSKYIASGTTSSPVAMADGTSVAVATANPSAGIPTAAGIADAVKVDGPFTFAGGVWTLSGIANCTVTYDEVTGKAVVNASGCAS